MKALHLAGYISLVIGNLILVLSLTAGLAVVGTVYVLSVELPAFVFSFLILLIKTRDLKKTMSLLPAEMATWRFM